MDDAVDVGAVGGGETLFASLSAAAGAGADEVELSSAMARMIGRALVTAF